VRRRGRVAARTICANRASITATAVDDDGADAAARRRPGRPQPGTATGMHHRPAADVPRRGGTRRSRDLARLHVVRRSLAGRASTSATTSVGRFGVSAKRSCTTRRSPPTPDCCWTTSWTTSRPNGPPRLSRTPHSASSPASRTEPRFADHLDRVVPALRLWTPQASPQWDWCESRLTYDKRPAPGSAAPSRSTGRRRAARAGRHDNARLVRAPVPAR
jgi:hypothetical protein